jgi:hypothetical protein
MLALSEKFYKTIPALAAYIDRIGAEERHFCSYAVVETVEGNYKRTKVRIKLDRKTGKVKVIDQHFALTKEQLKEFEPKKREQSVISKAWKSAKIPKAIAATKANLNDLRSIATGTLYDCKDMQGGIVFVQERRDREDGGKDYLPWTFFNDGQYPKRTLRQFGTFQCTGLRLRCPCPQLRGG